MNETSSHPRTGPRAIVISAMILIFAMINFGDKAVLGLAEVSISQELHLSHSTYGLVASSFFLLFSISALAVGFVSNRVGARWVLLTLAVLWSLAQVPVLAVASTTTLFVSRITLGAAEGPAAAVATHGVYQWFPAHRRGLPSALYPIGAGLGVFTAAPVLTSLITHSGWRAAFLALAAVGLIWAVVWLLIGREGPYAATSRTATTTATVAETPEPAVAYRRLLTCPTWLGSAIATFGMYWALAVGSAFVPAYLITQHGFTPGMAASAVSLYALLYIVGPIMVSPLVSWLHNRGVSSRWSRGATQGIVVAISGAGMVALPHATATGTLFGLVAVAFGVGVIVFPLAYLTTSEVTPLRQRGASFGVLIAVQTLPGLISPAVTGWLIDAAPTTGSGYTAAFTVGGLIMLACGIVALVAIRPERDAARFGLGGIPAAAGHQLSGR
ncbi:MAG: MFS transporter [Nocardioidaceae bacterium]